MEALTGERLLLGLPGRLEQCLSGKSSKVSRVVSRQEIVGRVGTTDPYPYHSRNLGTVTAPGGMWQQRKQAPA